MATSVTIDMSGKVALVTGGGYGMVALPPFGSPRAARGWWWPTSTLPEGLRRSR